MKDVSTERRRSPNHIVRFSWNRRRAGSKGSDAAQARTSQGFADAAACGLQNFDPGKGFVVALDQRPGRDARTGALDHVVYGALVVTPLRPVAPVLGSQLPLLVLRLLALLEAPQLFLLRDVDPVLDQADAVVDELVFE